MAGELVIEEPRQGVPVVGAVAVAAGLLAVEEAVLSEARVVGVGVVVA